MPTIEKAPKFNPRFILWLRSRGVANPHEFNTTYENGHVSYIGTLPWTLVFTGWTARQRHAWAEELGFSGVRNVTEALGAGHTEAEFDAWLEEKNRE